MLLAARRWARRGGEGRLDVFQDLGEADAVAEGGQVECDAVVVLDPGDQADQGQRVGAQVVQGVVRVQFVHAQQVLDHPGHGVRLVSAALPGSGEPASSVRRVRRSGAARAAVRGRRPEGA